MALQTEKLKEVRKNTIFQRAVRQGFSYLFLLFGSSFMLLPLLWMLSASFKPQWQIFANPIIWVPQHWEQVQAGDTNRMLPLWRYEQDGETRHFIRIGVRRYTTVINAALLTNLQSVPQNELGVSEPVTLDSGTVVNVRDWTSEGGMVQVVAVARGDNDHTIVVALDDLQSSLMRLPLDIVNSGDRGRFTVEDVEFRGREVAVEEAVLQLIPIGPESEVHVVAPPEVAAEVRLVSAELVESGGFAQVGETEIAMSRINGDPEDYILLLKEQWQPIINEDELDEHAFLVQTAQLGERIMQEVNGVSMQTAVYAPQSGSPVDVFILVSGTEQSLAMSVEQGSSLGLAQAGGLTSARGDTFQLIPYRVQDTYSAGDSDDVRSVALVGETRDMALVVPRASIDEAYDVPPENLERSLVPGLRTQGYEEVLATRIGETYFANFFLNSLILVILNIIGHVVSCVLVAYAFARLRAPGKNVLFIILLGTMMLPFPVTLVPVYEIFSNLDMVNTWWPLFLRAYFGNAFLIFMLRQFFAAIPRELEEAARIDGASVLQIVWRVIVPLSKPAIATVVIFTFWWTWNSFLEPFIYLSSPELFPVSVGLNFFKEQFGAVYYDRLIAASVLSMAPMLVIFFLAQRYFIEGIQLTGIKG